ncbi:AAA+-type ATPase, SpoVK/Ycf46/Vps4 family [Butyrivibrio sp. ob235]|uniref:AAA family ATPase n=1 Tax=Butyrivibrio sp. ob235 TaxID=1761780 RepID=UPI0008D6354D|nr:AAA family ATPase [Butyrivibrio sp. ob235]SEL92325.1 AAA+-type ATPase, SpoVK/Ycf46/Vps4 family [Butyrivibrio sp. ob235]
MSADKNNIKTEYSVGVVIVGENGKNELQVLIPKGSTLPATGGDEFYTRVEHQKAISIRVMGGEDKDIRFATPIGICRMELRKKYGRNAAIRYCMTYEKDGRISLELTDEDHETIGKTSFNRSCDLKPLLADNHKTEYRFMITEKLSGFVGIDCLKRYMLDVASQIEFNRFREEKLGIEEEGILENLIFIGNPGTGKTSVARLIGEIYKELGILSKGHLVEVSRADIVKGYQGQTAIRVSELIEDALGGVLFIDEAYSLKTDNSDSFGQEAVDALVKGIEDNKGKLLVILAGYKKEMDEFIRTNTGFLSRFSRTIEFPDYSVDELLDIAENVAADRHFIISEDGMRAFAENIGRQMLGESFGNARTARNIIETAILNKARNFSKGDVNEHELSILTATDFNNSDDIPPEEKAKRALDELQNLIGLGSVKKEIETVVAIAKYRMEEGVTDTDLPINMHMVFTGNPGTGKTTVARLFGQILHEIGLLKKGQLIEVSRSDLVGQYQGHTAIKTADICHSAYGGILFIDEAYSLMNGEMDTFGMEAVATLIKEMEDNKDKLVVIMAGYSDEMDRFLESNPGLRSRIGEIIEFPDYDGNELCEIFSKCAVSRKLICSDEVMANIRTRISVLKDRKDFGNARDMRSLAEDIWKNMIRRIEMDGLTGDDRKIVKMEDIPDLE